MLIVSQNPEFDHSVFDTVTGSECGR